MNNIEKKSIRVLHLEDDPNDAELISATLDADGLSCEITRIDNREQFVAMLTGCRFDMILSDYSLPMFDGLTALRIAREMCPEIPFILLSGMLGEEVATDSMKAGATDYVLKQRLERLAPSVKRAMREADEREQRFRAEEALKESEEKYRNLVDNLDIGVSLISSGMEIVTCNPQVRKWFPFIESNEQRGIATRCETFCRRDSQQEYYECPVQMVITDGKKHECVKELHTGDGAKLFRIMATPENDSTGKITGIIEIMEDVTEKVNAEKERKELEERLMQAQKMEAIGTLAGGIAHDLNNILSPVMAYTEMVLMDMPPGSVHESSLSEVLKATERARDLIRQILTFSRQKQKEIKPVIVNDIINEVLKLLRPSTPSTIEIRYDNDSGPDLIFADPTQIHQVIMNLCTNAAYAMREKGGVLEIKLSTVYLDRGEAAKFNNLKAGQYKKLCIRDNGIGMDKDVIKRIFEPYFTTKKIGEGTGMGLAVIHGIIKCYDGDITVESQPGKGSTFCVYLPKAEDSISSPLTHRNGIETGNGHILLVDDEKAIVEAMQSSLKKLGYEVTATTDSRECLKRFTENPQSFNLVITDMTMPNLTGKELAAQMLTIRPDIPILLCTGYNEMIDEDISRDIGITAFIMKPVSLREIAAKIHEILQSGDKS